MSGEKAHYARVVSEDELRRRALSAARARCGELQSELANLASQVEGQPASVRITDSDELQALQSIEQELHSAIRDTKAALSLQQSRARLEVISSRMKVGAYQEVTLAITQRSPASPQHEKRARMLERLSEVESQATLDALTERISETVRLSQSEQQRSLLELDQEITAVVKQQRVRIRCQSDARAEVLKLAHVEGDVADSIRSRALAVTDQLALASFRAEVRDVLAEAEREANAAFITQQAMLVMADLGYTVDEPFELIEQNGDGFFARRDDLPEHALQVSVDSTAGVLQTRVLAVGQTTTNDDVRAEDVTCDDALALVKRLRGRGVESEALFYRSAGELPVAKSPKTVPRKRKRVKLKEMELNR